MYGKLSSNSKCVKCIETQEVFPSMRNAEKVIGIKGNHISDVCKGKRKTAGGFHWEFINKEINT